MHAACSCLLHNVLYSPSKLKVGIGIHLILHAAYIYVWPGDVLASVLWVWECRAEIQRCRLHSLFGSTCSCSSSSPASPKGPACSHPSLIPRLHPDFHHLLFVKLSYKDVNCEHTVDSTYSCSSSANPKGPVHLSWSPSLKISCHRCGLKGQPETL